MELAPRFRDKLIKDMFEIIDQYIHMITINVGIQEIQDVFLDGSSGVNIINIENF